MKLSSSDHDLAAVTWHKSSYSDGSGGNCLEVAAGQPDIVPVRDSKATGGPALVFRSAAWAAFVTGLKLRQ
ncbi:DUF397 domain-containing protein [Streptomyces sp. NPDC049970]|uniref:DUF397 domain-containing protein n=1 Tax=Streptomyces sp. NPDC049970 TaxID=3155033 RepID=UPI003421DA9C